MYAQTRCRTTTILYAHYISIPQVCKILNRISYLFAKWISARCHFTWTQHHYLETRVMKMIPSVCVCTSSCFVHSMREYCRIFCSWYFEAVGTDWTPRENDKLSEQRALNETCLSLQSRSRQSEQRTCNAISLGQRLHCSNEYRNIFWKGRENDESN